MDETEYASITDELLWQIYLCKHERTDIYEYALEKLNISDETFINAIDFLHDVRLS